MTAYDPARVKAAASALRAVMARHAGADAQARALSEALAPFLAQAISGTAGPIEWSAIPGATLFSEGGLGRYPDLEAAYASFRIEVSGGSSPVLERLRKKRGGHD
ncbi:hypothetical protein [Paludibacterium paludis]|uniref:Uncharacterized protein n=1 Tax=Paludibacterium paludis TaxID=1225769 RepID=A0A918U8P5_9NEIS|nr:hypothetical protein [Paludibacterium paludis]GGY10952.1 hypothetical protein GCM10011289_12230 [Paludibacterium paludis]